MSPNELEKFKNLRFDDFRRLAQDKTLSQYEKIGFPNAYREGKEENIFSDIMRKLDNLNKTNRMVLDIGPGCSDLAFMVKDLCHKRGHTLLLVDSPEMLDQLPDEPFVTKIPGRYPSDCMWLFDEYAGKVDAILIYSVLHYVFVEGNIFDFLDRSLILLSDGGQLLIGDIPNVSKHKRFFSSCAGIEFHQEFTSSGDVPVVTFNTIEAGQIDDAVILSLIMRCRNVGFDAYLMPQPADLPMANRREDILIRKP